MIAFAPFVLAGALQTVAIPMAPSAAPQAAAPTIATPAIPVPDTSQVNAPPAYGGPYVTVPGKRPVPQVTPQIVPQASAASASAIGVSSSPSASPLHTRDRTAFAVPQPPTNGLPQGVTGGPVFGGQAQIQTGMTTAGTAAPK